MNGRNFFNIATTPIQVQAALEFVADAAHGAAALFVGSVRHENEGKPVVAVSYDVFAALSRQVFADLADEARARWGEQLHIYIEHYQGRLDTGGVSVVIAVSSPHRAESFDCCRYLIEEIKRRVPIWKQEHYVDGDSEWLAGNPLSAAAPTRES